MSAMDQTNENGRHAMPGTGEIAQLLETLKRALKGAGLDYVMLAARLGVSVATVKRRLNNTAVSIAHLQEICHELGFGLGDMMEQARCESDAQRPPIAIDQERALADDLAAALVFQLVWSGWSAAEIAETYAVAPLSVTRLLLKLDRLRLIDLLPGDRVVVRVARSAGWARKGPMAQVIDRAVADELHGFDSQDERQKRIVESAELSDASIMLLHDQLAMLQRQVQFLRDRDRRLPRARKRWTTVVALAKPTAWALELDGARHVPHPPG